MHVVTQLRSRTGLFPRAFWLLVAGTFVYLVGYECAYPFETIYLHNELGVSMTSVGLIFGLSLLAGLPMQIVGGAVADRYGRRGVLVLAISATIVLLEGLALTRVLWQVVALIAFEAACGWAMFLTANSAIVADLTPPERRAEAFSISRVAATAGMVVGPLAGSLLLGLGGGYRPLFLVGGAICAVFLALVVFWFPETKPSLRRDEDDGPPMAAGYRMVIRDRRFLLFCTVTLLPLWCHGQFLMTFPVLLRNVVGVSSGTWGYLLALYALSSTLLQYPVVRYTHRWDKMLLMTAASALIGVGLGSAAFAPRGWPTVVSVLTISLGGMLLNPISFAIVSQMAPTVLRGRYMGVWTLVWEGGVALGPIFGGAAMDRLGGRGAYALVLSVGLIGSALYATLRRSRAFSEASRADLAQADSEGQTAAAVGAAPEAHRDA